MMIPVMYCMTGTQKARDKIEEIKSSLGMPNPWRTCYPDAKRFTWRQSSPVQRRIDYFLVPEDIVCLLKSAII